MESAKHNGDKNGALKDKEVKQVDFSKRLSIYSLNNLDMKCDDDVRCGYGPCKPNFLQKCNNPKVLLICLGLFNFAQGYMIQGTMNQATSSLERRFALTSTQVSLINTSYDIFSGVLIIPMGLFIAFSHKPRLLACGALSISFGAFLMVLPHIIGGEYELGKETMIPVCDPLAVNTTSIVCKDSLKDRQGLYIAIFIIGQLFNAIGGTTLNLLSLPLLDENVKMKNLPLYAGTNQAINNLGPALAFILGSRFLALYVDIGRVDMDDINLEPRDPAWVGAYWMGFVCSGCVLLPSALLLFCFNYETPAARINARSRECEAHDGKGVSPTEKKYHVSIKDIPSAFKLLCTNPIVIVLGLILAIRLGVIGGMVVFITKYIQFQFSVSPAKASLTIGAIILPTSVIGMIGGGWFIRCFDLKIRGMFILNIVAEIIGIPLALCFLFRCNDIPLAGVVVPYENTILADSIYSQCNSNCACPSHKYDPYCGVDNKVYFTPCFAGCSNKLGEGEFGPCQCIDEAPYNGTMPIGEPANKVAEGTCDESCNQFYFFIIGVTLYLFTNFVTGQSGQTCLVRSVPERERTLAMGVLWTIGRFLGSIPFPIILGAVFDNACKVWERKCGEKGSCWIYDGQFLSHSITAWVMVSGVISTILYSVALKLYKPPSEDTLELYANRKKDQTDDGTLDETF